MDVADHHKEDRLSKMQKGGPFRPIREGAMKGCCRVGLCGLVLTMAVMGCGGHIYPRATGSHVRGEVFPTTVVIWTEHPRVAHDLAEKLLQWGSTDVERARLERVLAEQNLRLSLAAGSIAQLNEEIRRAGKLVGATRIIFADAQRERGFLYGPHEVKAISVTVRGVSVETGQVLWSGTADLSASGVIGGEGSTSGWEGQLAVLAMERAACMGEWQEWRESGPYRWQCKR